MTELVVPRSIPTAVAIARPFGLCCLEELQGAPGHSHVGDDVEMSRLKRWSRWQNRADRLHRVHEQTDQRPERGAEEQAVERQHQTGDQRLNPAEQAEEPADQRSHSDHLRLRRAALPGRSSSGR